MYFGNWQNYKEMLEDWGKIEKPPVPSEDGVLFASYGSEEYEGHAIVLFVHGGQLYEVNGSHCSCYGLEDGDYTNSASGSQWEPEVTSWKALQIRVLDCVQHSDEARTEFRRLVEANLKQAGV